MQAQPSPQPPVPAVEATADDGWQVVEKKQPKTEDFVLRPQDWGSPLILFADLASKFEAADPKTVFEAVVHCKASDIPVARRILGASGRSYSALLSGSRLLDFALTAFAGSMTEPTVECRRRRGGGQGREEWWRLREAAAKWELGAAQALAAAGQLLHAELRRHGLTSRTTSSCCSRGSWRLATPFLAVLCSPLAGERFGLLLAALSSAAGLQRFGLLLAALSTAAGWQTLRAAAGCAVLRCRLLGLDP